MHEVAGNPFWEVSLSDARWFKYAGNYVKGRGVRLTNGQMAQLLTEDPPEPGSFHKSSSGSSRTSID